MVSMTANPRTMGICTTISLRKFGRGWRRTGLAPAMRMGPTPDSWTHTKVAQLIRCAVRLDSCAWGPQSGWMTRSIYCVAHPHWEAFAHRGVQATDRGLAVAAPKPPSRPHTLWKGCSVTLSHDPTVSTLTQPGELTQLQSLLYKSLVHLSTRSWRTEWAYKTLKFSRSC